jgi:hypothetical protein
VIGNLRWISLPRGKNISGSELINWQRKTSPKFLNKPLKEEVSGVVARFKFERKTEHGTHVIHLFGDSHINQEGNLCDDMAKAETPITYFGKLFRNFSGIFLGETPLIHLRSSVLPHSILGTCRWMEKVAGVKYIPWDVRWNTVMELQTRIHKGEKAGSFQELIEQFKTMDKLLSYTYSVFVDNYKNMWEDDERITNIYYRWRDERFQYLVKKYQRLSELSFKEQRNAMHESTAYMTDSYIILQLLNHPFDDVVVLGGSAHISTLIEYVRSFGVYKLSKKLVSDDGKMCLKLRG